jgi:uncharacterized protein
METPIVFRVNGQQVVGMLHMPDRRKGRVPAVVFFHGFTGTKVEPHRIFVKTARALAAAGIAALRFDFRGSGDSGGEFSRMTVTGELKDARAALAFLRKQKGIDPARIGVVGLSMGGAVAAEILGEDRAIRAAALWSPVASLEKLIRNHMPPTGRRQLAQMGVVDDHGNAVGKMFFDDSVRHRPVKAIARTKAAILLVHGSNDGTVPVEASGEYERALRKARRAVVRHVIEAADHTYNSLEWETQVIALTLGWFTCNFG